MSPKHKYSCKSDEHNKARMHIEDKQMLAKNQCYRTAQSTMIAKKSGWYLRGLQHGIARSDAALTTMYQNHL